MAVSLSEASKIAQLVITSSTPKARATLEPNFKLTPIPDEKGENICYVINYEGGGFVVLAADKRIIPILAYSKTGNFEVSKDLTSSIIYWLHTVKEALKEARKTSDKALELWNIKYINRILKSNFDSKLFNSAGKGRETTEPPGEDPGCQFS